MITHRTSTSRPHEQTVIDMLRDDPEFSDEYLAVALDEIDQPGGQAALLAALRHSTIKTLLAVINGVGLHLAVTRADHTPA